SEFIAVASHELRTPISIIRGWEDLMRGGMVKYGDPQYAGGLDAIARSCAALEKIAVSATRMAQVDDADQLPEPSPTLIEPMLAEAVREARAAGPERVVAVSVEVAAGTRTAVVDGMQVMHAVDALVRNGIRFTPDGGDVRVRAWTHGEDLVIEVRDS